MSRLQKEAGNSVSGLVWDGESQELIKAEINRYADAANKLASDYYGHVRDLWAQYGGIDMPEYDPPTITADRAVWQMEGGFNNTDFMGLHYKDVIPDENGAVHNNAGRTIDDLWPTFTDEEQALEYVQNMVQTVGRLTMQRAVASDPTKPRWARVPRGAKTCAFCLMLASRGFAYLSEDTAGRQMQYHTDCDCDIVPSWGKAKLRGYDPDKLKMLWEDAKEQAGFYGSDDYKSTLRILRAVHPGAVRDGSEFKPDMRVPAGCLLERQIGAGCAREINSLLAASKYKETVRLWAKYADQYAISDFTLPRGAVAHFNPNDGGISINIDEIGKAKPGHPPYSVFLHESAHMLDWILAEEANVEYYSAMTHGGRAFKMTLDADARSWLRAEMAKISHGTAAARRTKALQAISETLYTSKGDTTALRPTT